LYRNIDGSALIVSSKDGYCTVITFDKNELGEPVDVVMKDPQ
jgi:hypothetical protein